jgi:hypothetical protein
MTTIDRHHEVIQMAANLGLDWKTAPTAAIINFCKERIAGWVAGASDIQTLDELEALVCHKLRLTIDEFSSDEELDSVIAKYVGKGEFVFATQRDGFGPETFATLIRRENATPTCPDQFVALVDCRGEKAHRRFFTRWHEIAHVLTLVRGQMALPFHRSTTNRDPVEQLMDKIAAEVGFFDDIFGPGVRSAIAEAGGSLSLDLVEQIRSTQCSRASFLATLIAVVTRAPVPAVSIEAGWGYKKSERRLLRTPGLFPEVEPKAELRVLTVGCNEAALQAGLRIHQNMRVPATSVIARVIEDPIAWGARMPLKAVESLEDWTTSSGGPIGEGKVTVEARRHGDHVIALVTRD